MYRYEVVLWHRDFDLIVTPMLKPLIKNDGRIQRRR